MTAVRLKFATVAVAALIAGIVLIAGSQSWGPQPPVGAPTAGASTAVVTLGVATLALLGALLLAGPLFRMVLSVLSVLLGIAVTAVAALGLTEVATGWPVVALIAGALQTVAGIVLVLTVRRWPAPASKYSKSRLDPWTALDEGNDPTSDR